MVIDVWVCAAGHYYASSKAGDLSTQQNRRTSMRNASTEPPEHWGQVTGTRDKCQICAQAGRDNVRRKVPFYDLQALEDAVGRALQAADQEAQRLNIPR